MNNLIDLEILRQCDFIFFDFDGVFTDNSVIVSGNSGPVDMCLMSKCNAHIIANSSFSWWAAALGSKNSVIAPKVWFGPEGPNNWDTVYFENWLRL